MAIACWTYAQNPRCEVHLAAYGRKRGAQLADLLGGLVVGSTRHFALDPPPSAIRHIDGGPPYDLPVHRPFDSLIVDIAPQPARAIDIAASASSVRMSVPSVVVPDLAELLRAASSRPLTPDENWEEARMRFGAKPPVTGRLVVWRWDVQGLAGAG